MHHTGKLLRNIFEANVRDYQGSTEVNQEIHATLGAVTKDEFWWLNNGVTMIAANATHSSKELTIEDPPIDNGLQTSTELYNFFRATSNAGDPRNGACRHETPLNERAMNELIN